jgi:hypothetical protein
MDFEVYLHFAVVYHDDYNFLIDIFFNHLIPISKWEFFFTILFFGFRTTFIPITICKKTFNISLVEV